MFETAQPFVVVTLLLASLTYRIGRGKPVLWFGATNARWSWRFASGYSRQSYRGYQIPIPGASGCLTVAIATGDRFVVRPLFPMTLFFFPEIWGLELDVPLAEIQDARPVQILIFPAVRLTFEDRRTLVLYAPGLLTVLQESLGSEVVKRGQVSASSDSM